MCDSETKHVSAELSEDEYERFREFATEQGLALEEAGRVAILEWIRR